MSKDNFERALALTLRFEGGFVNHPKDPGGATNMGITRATLADWRGRPVSVADVRNLKRADAVAIYRRTFWDQIGGDRLPLGIDAVVFDYAVNSGISAASRALQASLGQTADGIVGPATVAAAHRADAARVIVDVMARRRGFLRRLRIFSTFGRGWLARCAAVETAALRMAAGQSSHAAALLSTKQEFVMNLSKSVLESRTVWANVIGFIALVASVFGLDTSGVDQAGLVDAILKTLAAGGFIASTIFRILATRQIG